MCKRTRHSYQPTSTTLSFEETIQNIKESLPSKKKRISLKTNQDTINFNTTFKPIDNKKLELKMKSPDMQVELTNPIRINSLSNIFFSMMNNDFLDKIIEYNSTPENLKNLPSVFSKNESTRNIPDIQQAKRDFVIKFYATKLYIQHDPKNTLVANFNVKSSIEVRNFEVHSMSFNIFEKMNRNFFIPIALVKDLNENMASLVKTGRIVCLDEKQKECSHEYHHGGHARWAKKKYGHWITQSAVLGPTTGLPIMQLLIPLTKVDRLNVDDEPYNDVPNSELVKETYEHMEEGSILLTDGYYPDMNVRRYLKNIIIIIIIIYNNDPLKWRFLTSI
jgi:hypothetical protein